MHNTIQGEDKLATKALPHSDQNKMFLIPQVLRPAGHTATHKQILRTLNLTVKMEMLSSVLMSVSGTFLNNKRSSIDTC